MVNERYINNQERKYWNPGVFPSGLHSIRFKSSILSNFLYFFENPAINLCFIVYSRIFYEASGKSSSADTEQKCLGKDQKSRKVPIVTLIHRYLVAYLIPRFYISLHVNPALLLLPRILNIFFHHSRPLASHRMVTRPIWDLSIQSSFLRHSSNYQELFKCLSYNAF